MTPEDYLQSLVDQDQLPGAAFAYGRAGSVIVGALGRTGFGTEWPSVTTETLYDLASLTKVFVTTEVARKVKIPLNLSVKDVLPGFASADVTVEHLLRHESGLPAYTECQESVLEHVLGLPLIHAPGTTTVYSCLGFIVLRHALERYSGTTFERLFEEFVSKPCGWSASRFCPLTPDACAPTKSAEVAGTVHDPLARAQGGVSGNAGLFGSSSELAQLCVMLIGDPEVKRWAARLPGHERGLGWDLKSAQESSCGSTWSADSFGHTGFTGTSVWFDPEQDFFALLLTNYISFESHLDIRKVRLTFADLTLACG